MNKIVLGLLVGALLGAIDGGTAWFTPAVRPAIVGIIIGSTFKGLIAGVAAGIFSREGDFTPPRGLFRLAGGFVLAVLVAVLPPGHQLGIILSGGVRGAVAGGASP